VFAIRGTAQAKDAATLAAYHKRNNGHFSG